MSAESIDAYEVACLEVGIENASPQKRVAAAKTIISLLQASSLPEEGQTTLSNLLLKLTVDPDRAVRKEVIGELKDLRGLSEDLVFSIISEDDELALPFLAVTKSLNKRMMTAIAKVGDAARKTVVAARGDCPAEAADIMIANCPAEIIVELLANPELKLSAAQFEKILERHGSEKPILAQLVRKHDLPAHLKVMMARAVSEDMRRNVDTEDMASTIQSQRMIDIAEEEAILQISAATKPIERAKLVTYLCDLQQLTPSLLLRAACTGEMAFVESALSLLSGLQILRVRNLMYSQGAMSLRAVHSRANLPRVLFDPLRIASDVEKERQKNDQAKSPDLFGKQFVEAIVTKYESFTPTRRSELLQIVQSYGSAQTRELAVHLLESEYTFENNVLAA